jgi:hypothetical protein
MRQNVDATNAQVINKMSDKMKLNVVSMSNASVGKVFNTVVNGIGRDDLGEILYNWNESQLNEDGDRIISYPGRDGIFSRGKEGGKINISKRAFLTWLSSDNPFDAKIYDANIRDNIQWMGLIQRAREAAFNNI